MAQLQTPIMPDRLYRYRSLSGGDAALTRELDAVEEKYLYCSPFSQMNDPMEGIFSTSRRLKGQSDFEKGVKQVTNIKAKTGIACFTETHEDVLMWTHYAGNYNGICLSYASDSLLKKLPAGARLVRMAYFDEPPVVSGRLIGDTGNAAIRVLSQKKYNWSYEREWRVLAEVGKIPVRATMPVHRIFIGSRVSAGHRKEILRRVGKSAIKIYAMNVAGYTHSWKPLNTAAKKYEGFRKAEARTF
jgi:hypothetical protein